MTQFRKDILVNNEYYHIFSRSIGGYVIFNNKFEFERMSDLINILRHKSFNYQFSQFKRLSKDDQADTLKKFDSENELFVDIVAYCLMPTHFHLILRQVSDHGITKYIAKLLNSYSKFFNIIHKRSGPLWAGRFKNIRIVSDEQLLHLTRYIHLNPCSANLAKNAEDWKYSSYNEYLLKFDSSFCNFKPVIDLSPECYKNFINDRKDYQQQISLIKHLFFEDYSG